VRKETAQVCQPFPFVDEAAKRPDFLAFRRALIAAIDRHDVEAIVAVADPDICLDFGGGVGPDILRRYLNEDAKRWQELRTVLTLGGTWREPDEFAAPYVYSAMPAGRGEYEDAAIIGAGVRVRQAPRPDAAVVTTMSYCVVELVPQQAHNEQWTSIVLGEGRSGYVSSRFVRSQVDYRAGFKFKNGRWQMTFFLAGD
jgi:hypothetical protein